MRIRVFLIGLAGFVLLGWGAWRWTALGFAFSFQSVFDGMLLSRNVIDKDSPIFAISLGLLCLAYAALEVHLSNKGK